MLLNYMLHLRETPVGVRVAANSREIIELGMAKKIRMVVFIEISLHVRPLINPNISEVGRTLACL